MATENTASYEAVLADLRARREQIDSAIAAIEGLIGGGTVISAPASLGAKSEEVRSDSFFGMSIQDAARKYLAMSKRPRSTPEIAAALTAGGLMNSSANFGNTVGSVLSRVNDSNGEIVRVGRGTWGLLDWYPGRRRKTAKASDAAQSDAADDGSDDLV